MKLTEKQENYLKLIKDSYVVKYRKLVNDKYALLIVENINQQRETVRNLSVTSSAIAALSLTLFSSEAIKNHTLLIIALFLMLLSSWLGYLYLKIILDKENKSLEVSNKAYNKEITNLRELLDSIQDDPSKEKLENLQKLIKFFPFKVKGNLSPWDAKYAKHIPDLMFIVFSLGLLGIILAFIWKS